jgi:tetratricopeptide (TPR) repeat protein
MSRRKQIWWLAVAAVALGTVLARLPLLTAAAGDQPVATGVRVWETETAIPTYLIGDPEPNPIFYFGRQSQGAQGRVYPYPLYDNLTFKKTDKKYRIVYLENEFVRIGVLPEVGGRLFEGVDKTNNYDFIYRQHVIKPALIGLIGAWISGGIEWNIPHHHRATSALPVQYKTEVNADGSKTIWVGELEMRSRMRWAVGYTLRPGKSYLEAKVRIVNRTPVVNTMLAFANVAVHVNENYQVFFPPSTRYGTYHSKTQFTKWPVSDSRYQAADFTKGVDISWYKNHITSNSIFAWNYEDDFFAGYDHGKKAGIMSVADHHMVPGKKLWTWGNGAAGRQWDHILTDNDGPYIELMVGAYSDNQPDYSWLQPNEAKVFSMYWYPFREIGGVKKANLDAGVNLDVADGTAKVGFYTTAVHPAAVIVLKAGDKVLLRETTAIGPAKPFTKQVAVPAGTDEHALRASISVNGKELVAYSPIRVNPAPMPKSVTPPAPPDQIKTTEELLLAGQRIEQFHNPGLGPLAYWQEALKRDPGDTRVNTAMGIWSFRRARFAEAERYFRTALARLTDKYTTPKDAEATYYLGLTLKAQGKRDEAFETLYKSTWNMAWRGAGYLEAAEIASARGDLAEAVNLVDRALEANALNIRALTLKSALLRHQDKPAEARRVLASAFRNVDPLDAGVMAEQWLTTRLPADARTFTSVMNTFPATASEAAAAYANAGLWKDGAAVLDQAVAAAPDKSKISPMNYYYLAYFATKLGDRAKASEYAALAGKLPPDYVFPFQYEAIDVLRAAIDVNPRDARAPYYLGNLLYDWQPAEAARYWERSAALDPSFAIVHRNLAVAYQHDGSPAAKAIAALEKAVSLDRKYPLHFTELDDLYDAAAAPPEKRLALLEKNHDIVVKRDDSLAREIALKVVMGHYDEAIQALTARRFAVWEGANLNVADDWATAHLLRGRDRVARNQFQEALTDFQAASAIPDNLPTSRGGADHGVEAAYWIGVAYEGMGDSANARASWTKAAAPQETGAGRGGRMGGPLNPARAYYRALALGKLGRESEKRTVLEELIRSAEQSLAIPEMGALGNARQNRQARTVAAHYARGLAQAGLGDSVKARTELGAALALNPAHVGARSALAGLK